jgi:DNA-binding transcriptional LysR family regulator
VVDVMSGRGANEIAAGRLDVAIAAAWSAPLTLPPMVRAHPLLADPMVVVLPDDHPLATGTPAGTRLRLEQLRDESWAAIVAGHAAREQFERAAHDAGFAPTVPFETESYDVAQALVATGSCVALVSRLALSRMPGITHRELAGPAPHRHIHALTEADTTFAPLADVFIGLLTDVASDISTTWPASGTTTATHHTHSLHETRRITGRDQ